MKHVYEDLRCRSDEDLKKMAEMIADLQNVRRLGSFTESELESRVKSMHENLKASGADDDLIKDMRALIRIGYIELKRQFVEINQEGKTLNRVSTPAILDKPVKTIEVPPDEYPVESSNNPVVRVSNNSWQNNTNRLVYLSKPIDEVGFNSKKNLETMLLMTYFDLGLICMALIFFIGGRIHSMTIFRKAVKYLDDLIH